MTIGIIGTGISGLTLAYELQQQGIDHRIWEVARLTKLSLTDAVKTNSPVGNGWQVEAITGTQFVDKLALALPMKCLLQPL